VRGRCGQQRRAEGEGDLRQLCGSRARGSEIISGQQNLDAAGSILARLICSCVSRRALLIDAAAASI
jgi:hypothetical protein